ncbi:MAG: WbqC family protein [Bacteroidales bacterium]
MYRTYQPALLSTAYLGPIRYFSKFVLHKAVFIEGHENYSKQSYRNRCTILTSNGPYNLSIPVKYSNNPKTSIGEVLLDYDTNWNKIHWQAIISAYRNSPFFEYYSDELEPFYSRKYEKLFDFNQELTTCVLRQMGIETAIMLTSSWESTPVAVDDYRNDIHPKPHKNKGDQHFREIPYTQVFQSKFGFVSGLSVLDLLFNAGPEASVLLEQSIK